MIDGFSSVEQGLTVCPGANTLPGLDVSHYDGTINWVTVKGSGILWAYAKATEGLGYVDPTFPTHWAGMKAAGVVRGAYHFFHPDVNGKQQADFFLGTVGPIGATDLPPMLDWETTTATGSTAANNAQQFIDEIKAKTGRKTVVYTSPGLWSSFNIGGTAFGVDPLFVAHYRGCTPSASCCPTMPSTWVNWVMWQFSATGRATGVSATMVDLDVFNGNLAQLTSFIASTHLGGTGGGGGGTGGGGTAGGGQAGGSGGAASGGGNAGGGDGTGGGGAAGAGIAGGLGEVGGGTAMGGGTAGGAATAGGTGSGGGGRVGGDKMPGQGCGCAAIDDLALWSCAAVLIRRRRLPKAG
jgi:lysozyme